jgi:hypothetical protein
MDVSAANHERSSPDLEVRQSRRKQALVMRPAINALSVAAFRDLGGHFAATPTVFSGFPPAGHDNGRELVLVRHFANRGQKWKAKGLGPTALLSPSVYPIISRVTVSWQILAASCAEGKLAW